jgi:DNA polymerase III epsilon subunit-like protein
MRYAILSTVSSDRMDYKLAADSAGQPRLAQMAVIFVADDGKPASPVTYTVKPDGWCMTNEATIASGVTDAMLEGGIPVAGVCGAYVSMLNNGYVVVAYGAPHHLKLMRGECRRLGIDDNYATTQSIDVCRALFDVCRIPNVGRKGYKLPKFEEACAHFKVECPPVRDAATNARLTLGLFRALVDLARLPPPSLPSKD